VRALSSRWALWLGVAAILVLGPAIFTLLRDSRFEATTELTPVAVAGYPEVTDPAYYRGLLGDPAIAAEILRTTGLGLRSADVELGPGSGGRSVVVTTTGATPKQAHTLVNALAHQLSQATRRQLAAEVQRELATLRPLESAKGRGPLRRRLDDRIEELEALGPLPPARAVPARPAPVPEPERWADRVVDALPGGFPGRPSPFWAAVAGLLLAATLWTIAFVLDRPRAPR
jgi:hypothetical protein